MNTSSLSTNTWLTPEVAMATSSSPLSSSFQNSSCSRCFDIKEAFPFYLSVALGFFCTLCVVAHILVYCRERGEARSRFRRRLSKKASRRQQRQEEEKRRERRTSDDDDDEDLHQQQSDDDEENQYKNEDSDTGSSTVTAEPESAFSCASLTYCLLQAVGFALLAWAAWQRQEQGDDNSDIYEGNDIVMVVQVAVGLTLVILGLFMCGWVVRRDQFQSSKKAKDDGEVPTDEESLTEEEETKRTAKKKNPMNGLDDSTPVIVVLKNTPTETETTLTVTDRTENTTKVESPPPLSSSRRGRSAYEGFESNPMAKMYSDLMCGMIPMNEEDLETVYTGTEITALTPTVALSSIGDTTAADRSETSLSQTMLSETSQMKTQSKGSRTKTLPTSNYIVGMQPLA